MRCNLLLLLLLITSTLKASPIGCVSDYVASKKAKAAIEISHADSLKIDRVHFEAIPIQGDGIGIEAESHLFVYSKIDFIWRFEKSKLREVQFKVVKPIRNPKSIAFTPFGCPCRFLNPIVLSNWEKSGNGEVRIMNNLIYSVKPSSGSIAVSKSHYYKYFKLANDES